MRKNFLQKILTGAAMFSVASMLFLSCAKDGKDGLTGATGANGLDANQTCKLCHNPAMVDSVSAQYEQLSKHSYGTASASETGNSSCAPCHEQEGFKYVCANNVAPTFTYNGTTWTNNYSSVSTASYGNITCFTCHSSLHTTYGLSDLTSLTTIAPVPMTMWGGAKTITLSQGGGISHLCVKCHEPRPINVGTSGISGGDGRLFPYDSLKNQPLTTLWDSTAGATQYWLVPSYRTGTHYGVVGAVYGGMGGIEFTGSGSGYIQYTNSKHTTVATCQDCHMAPMFGQAGGHSFRVRNNNNSNSGLTSSTTWNFNGCNTVACHGAPGETAMSSVSGNLFVTTRATVKALLDTLANHINLVGGGNTHPILHVDATTGTGLVTNLWLGVSSKNYDGYLDIYDSPTGSNPNGYWVTTTTVPTGKAKLPTLKFVHLGALINFDFALREYSLGIHNTNYVKALLTNTIQALKDAGY